MNHQFPQLATDRLFLRQITPADAASIYRIFSDDAVTKYYDIDSMTDIEQAEQLIASMQQRFEQGEGIRWGIACKSDNQLAGTCGYNRIFKRYFRGIIGYDLGRAYWGQGIMGEALQAMLEYGFEMLKLHRIEALVMLGNERSVRVLEKLGFQEEGVLRGYGFWKDTFWDLRCFSLLAGDEVGWRARLKE